MIVRSAAILFVMPALIACGGCAPLGPPITSTLTAAGSIGSRFTITPIDPPMSNQYMVEQSEVWTPVGLKLFYDLPDGVFDSLTWDSSTGQWTNQTTLDSGIRFPYVTSFNGQLLSFYLNASNGSIYLKVSTDNGATWTLANGGSPVLTKSNDVNSIYHNLWNVGVAIASDGTAYLVVECQRGNDSVQSAVGLGYSYGTYDSTAMTLNFDANRTSRQVVVGGGNPFLWVDDSTRNLVAIHGMFNQLDSPFYWFVTASVRKNGIWTTRRDLFQIAQQNIHVGDPSGFSYNADGSDSAIAFSYNQFGTKVAKAAVPFVSFMKQLLQ